MAYRSNATVPIGWQLGLPLLGAMALAVARVAARPAPVVVAADRFASADAAARWLGSPVIRLAP